MYLPPISEIFSLQKDCGDSLGTCRHEKGIIVKGIGGFDYVAAAGKIWECRARGAFRNQKMTPLVGDRVEISIYEGEHENAIERIEPRRNALRRPPVANIDQLFIVVSSCEPRPNTLLIDRLTVLAVRSRIQPVIILTKSDLGDVSELQEIYRTTGFPTLVASGVTDEGLEAVRALLPGKISAFTGNSGVGKSTLLNRLNPEWNLETAPISKKLGRGKHTTRASTLLELGGGYVVDTPGFASLELQRDEVILKEDLADCFPEFRPYLDQCKFYPSCSHVRDKGCAVLQAVSDGAISESRHESYVAMYNEVKDVEAWQLRQKPGR